MEEGKTEEEEQNTSLTASIGDTKEESSHDMNKISDAVVSAQQQKEEEEDDDAALAHMMAFQEEQDEEDTTTADPNVALLPGDNNNNEQQREDEEEVVPHPNLNNPAAVALRNRQALQNAARQNAINNFQNQPYLIRKLNNTLRPILRYTPLSIIAAVLLIHHTLRTRQQFYLALVYLQSSKLAYILLGNAIIALAVSTFTLMTKIFLDGGLRPNERDSIGEHIRWDVTETCLALTIFRSELDVVTAIEFLGLVILKCLHWSVELRGNHLRMTEEVFVYPEEDNDDNIPSNEDPAVVAQLSTPPKAWYRRIPHLRMTHIRYYSLVEILLMLDILAVAHCALSVATHGPSVDILFGFEAAILLVSGLSTLGMYNLHIIDGIMGVFHHLAEGEHHNPVGGLAEPNENEVAREGGSEGDATANNGEQQQQEGEGANTQQDGTAAAAVDTPPATQTKTFAKKLVERLANPWRDRRATLSFAIELQAQAAKFLFYVVFFAIVFTYYGMPINIFREVYVSFQQLRRRLIAFNTYRRLTHNMDKRFESIKDEEELDRLGHTCIICRDQMDLSGGCKKLPGCGHAFHAHCLREWLVQQQTCPTCRADIAANEARIKKQKAREVATALADEAAAQREEGRAGDDLLADVTEDVNGDAPSADNTNQPDASTAQGDASQAQEQQSSDQSTANKSTTNSATSQSEQQSKSTSTSEDTLPSGWTQHVDGSSGKTYYFNRELGKSSWDKPKETAAAMSTNQDTQRQLASAPSSPHFPGLYRVTFAAGAPVFPNRNHSQALRPPPRIIPCGKLVVCLSIEYWPLPFQEAMLRTPDGCYIRSRDVKRFMKLTEAQGEGSTAKSTAMSAVAAH